MAQVNDKPQWRFKGPEMEGPIARWYTRLRSSGSQMEEYRRQASRLTDGLPTGTAVLEVAPGPGYLAIEMTRTGRCRVIGLDISRTFVEIATENARQAAVGADFRRGDVANLPFEAESFDLVVCQAAFKNFAQPVRALDEMHRVLRGGGTAVIQDMNRDTTKAAIDEEVKGAQLGWLNAFMMKRSLTMLRRRAYSPAQFERLAAASAFGTCEIQAAGIGMEVRLKKR